MSTKKPGRLALRTMVIKGFLAALWSQGAYAEALPAKGASEIRFTASVSQGGGQVVCALFRENGWLKRPTATVTAALRGHAASCVFAGVGAGVYAIVAFHDENGNGIIDKNFLGVPTESWCTSRNAKGLFGPPSFDSAKFRVQSGVIRLTGSM